MQATSYSVGRWHAKEHNDLHGTWVEVRLQKEECGGSKRIWPSQSECHSHIAWKSSLNVMSFIMILPQKVSWSVATWMLLVLLSNVQNRKHSAPVCSRHMKYLNWISSSTDKLSTLNILFKSTLAHFCLQKKNGKKETWYFKMLWNSAALYNLF